MAPVRQTENEMKILDIKNKKEHLKGQSVAVWRQLVATINNEKLCFRYVLQYRFHYILPQLQKKR